jgi:hypothetical protein
MTTLIINIKELLQVREIELPKYLVPQWPHSNHKNAYLLLEDLIADFGSMSVPKVKADKTIDDK